MTDIKELALQEAKDMLLQHYYDNGDYATFSVELCTRFLAAYLAEQEPVAYRIRQYGRSKLVWANHQMTRSENDGMVFDALFTAPPLPEPAPCKDEVWNPGEPKIGPNYEAGLWSRRNWEAMMGDQQFTEPTPKEAGFHDVAEFYKESPAVSAAPSSEEVREMMKYLYSIDEHIAANMIERLAARVPDGLCIGGRHE